MDFQSEVLVDLFTNSPFLGFLIWQYITMRKDYKEAQLEMREIRDKAKAQEEKIRERWEGVVAKLDQERKAFMSEGVEKMNHIEKDVHSTKKTIVKMAEELKEIRYTAFEIINAFSASQKEKD